MKTLNFLIFTFLIVFSVLAEARVSVRGYFRKNGTYVAPHYRSSPDGNFYNNWSTKGNINPYTGQEGTKTNPSSSDGTDSTYSPYSGSYPSPTEEDKSPTSSSTNSTETSTEAAEEPSMETIEQNNQQDSNLTELKNRIRDLEQKVEALEKEMSDLNQLNQRTLKVEDVHTSDISDIRVIYAPKPTYSREDRILGLQGKCSFAIFVNESGVPTKILITKSTGHRELDNKTLAKLQEWRFAPGTSGWTTQSFRWELRGAINQYGSLRRNSLDITSSRQPDHNGITNAFYYTSK